MRLKLPSTTVALVAALLALAVVVRIIDPEPVARLRLSIFDAYQRLMPRTPDPAQRVKIVHIDTESLERVGQWPWPRTRLAQMIERLTEAGARVIALDLILAEPDRLSPADFARLFEGQPQLAGLAEEAARLPSNDERLAAAIGAAPAVLGFVAESGSPKTIAGVKAKLAFAGDDPQLFVPAFSGGTSSLALLTERAAGLGSVNWLPANDQIVRRVPLLVSVGGTIYPSLPLEAARVAMGESTIFVRSSGGSGALAFGQKTGVETVRVGPVVLPTDANAEMWLRFSEHDLAGDIPAYRVLDGSFEHDAVRGKHVLIGVSAPGLLDLRATPLQSAVPGVVIHAQALEQILSGQHLSRPSFAIGFELLFLVAVGGMVAFLIQSFGPVPAALTGAAAIIAVSGASWLAFSRQGVLLDPVYPSLALVAIYIAGSLGSYIKAELDRSFVRSAFGHYLAPTLVEELANNHDKLKLGGEMRDVTVLFADVRGFSRNLRRPRRRGADPVRQRDLHAAVGGHSRAARHHRQVHGRRRDGILERAGRRSRACAQRLPGGAADARRACRAQSRQGGAGGGPGEIARPVSIGIGLNTGECCVGNVGSPQRFDYSILGDPVNIASRLQDATKTYGAGDHRRRADRGRRARAGIPRHRHHHAARQAAARAHLCPAG